jgi:hypothetical protein
MEIYRADILRKRELRQKSGDAQPQASPLIAQLIGSRGCEALGIVATGNAPVLGLCRKLLFAGVNPDSALAVYRDRVLSLRIRSIGEAARLTVKEQDHGRAQFARWKPFPSSPVGSPMRKNRRRAA